METPRKEKVTKPRRVGTVNGLFYDNLVKFMLRTPTEQNQAVTSIILGLSQEMNE